MKKIFFCSLGWMVLTTIGLGVETYVDKTQKIITEIKWDLWISVSWYQKGESHSEIITQLGRGSCWALSLPDDEVVLVTARHVIFPVQKAPLEIRKDTFVFEKNKQGRSIKPEESSIAIDNQKNKITRFKTVSLIGGLASNIEQVANLSGLDISLIRPALPEVKKVISAFDIAEEIPQTGDVVEVCGHPNTVQPQIKRLTITSVSEKYLILNEKLDEGYSGGVVYLPQSNKALGVITSVSEKQTTVHRITAKSLENLEWSKPNEDWQKLE